MGNNIPNAIVSQKYSGYLFSTKTIFSEKEGHDRLMFKTRIRILVKKLIYIEAAQDAYFVGISDYVLKRYALHAEHLLDLQHA